MKKNYLFSIMIICALAFTATAQTEYGFTHSNGTYTPLISPTAVSAGTVWDDEPFTATIGFTFNFFGDPYTEVTIKDRYIYFGLSEDIFIIPMGADLADRGDVTSLSPISSKLEGSAPNRIFKIEWKNAGFFEGDEADSASFQVWLHEGTDDISIVYGPSFVTDLVAAFQGDGPVVEIGNNVTDQYYRIYGDPANPSVDTAFSINRLNGMPANGKIYYFGDKGIGIEDRIANHGIKIAPNPFNNEVFISTSIVPDQLQLFDVTGKKVMEINAATLQNGRVKLDMSSIKPGVYFVQAISDRGVETHKVVKQ